MTIEIEGDRAKILGVLGIDETEPLLEWLRTQDRPQLDLSACTHLHAANLQVLMVRRPQVSAWPDDPALTRWLEGALGVP